MLENVYGLLVKDLTIGDMCRLSRVSKSMLQVIDSDNEFWSGLHARVGLKPTTRKGHALTRRSLQRRIMNSSRCRQCGHITRGRVRLSTGIRIPMCHSCTKDGYARLISRRDIHNIVQTLDFRPKQRCVSSMFSQLTIAKYTWKGAHLYWPSEVHSRLRFWTQDKQ